MKDGTLAFLGSLVVLLAGCGNDNSNNPSAASRADQSQVAPPSQDGELVEAVAVAVSDNDGRPSEIDASNPSTPLARFVAAWAPDSASCGTPSEYRFAGRAIYTPESRCVVFSGRPEDGAVVVRLTCLAGAEGRLPKEWPMPAPQLIDTWVIEPLGQPPAMAALRLDRGPDGTLELVRCGNE